jgi:pyruvate dehydrogenase E2 component (dihydrolipoamide acetyltransferase)
MTEAAIVKWVKKEGEAFAPGDVLLEVETDKATMEIEAQEAGVLERIVVPEGAGNVKVDTVIAHLAGNGAAGSAAATAGAAGAPGGTGRVFASPLARRLAAERGLDIASVAGSGPNGRVVKADVEAVSRAGAAAPGVRAAVATSATPATRATPGLAAAGAGTPASTVSARPPATSEPPASAAARRAAAGTGPRVPGTGVPAAPPGGYDEVPHTNTRRVIAQRLSEAKRTIPHFYLTVDCEVDALLAARRQANEQVEGLRLSVNDFVVKAAALALRRFPDVNAAWTEDAMRRHRDVDVAVAVSTPGGLLTPVLRSADTRTLGQISAEVRELAERARAGQLRPEEYQGGGLTVSNLGMYGIREFSAIINPPQSCILAVGSAEQRPVVRDGALAVATVMTCTLSVDHRVIDGVLGAEFLAAFRRHLEAPFTLLV